MERKHWFVSAACALAIASGFGTIALSGCGELGNYSDDWFSVEMIGKGEVSQETSAAYYDLGLDLLKACEPSNGNVLVSSVSLSRPLAVLAEGAEGTTKQEIENVLGFSGEASVEDMKELAASWDRMSDFDVVDSLWINETFLPKESFVRDAEDDFGVEVFKKRFNNAMVNDANAWVNEHTRGMIPSILTEPMDGNAAILLLNACAFDSKWAVSYDAPAPTSGGFTNKDGSVADVDMLIETEDEGYIENEDCYGFIKPYMQKSCAFVGIKPADGTTLTDLLQKIDGDMLEELISSAAFEDVRSELPKFHLESDLNLNDALKELGMRDAFVPHQANFAGVSEKPTYVSEVEQKTYIDVNEIGTKAAAATAIESYTLDDFAVRSSPKSVILDEPFLYLIIDTKNNTPLFVGTYSTVE